MVIFMARVPYTKVHRRRFEEFDATYAINFEAFLATDHRWAAKFASSVHTEAIEATSRTWDADFELIAGDSDANFHATAVRAVSHAAATALATQVDLSAVNALNAASESSTEFSSNFCKTLRARIFANFTLVSLDLGCKQFWRSDRFCLI